MTAGGETEAGRLIVGAGAGAGPLFELPPELAIDTDVATRVMVGFIRNQLRQAGFSRGLLGLSGGIDSALVAFLVAQAIGPESMLCVLMPYRTSSPESVEHARLVVDQLGCASDLVDISQIVDGYLAVTASWLPAGLPRVTRLRCAAVTSWHAPGCASSTTVRYCGAASWQAPATRPNR